MGGRGAEIGFQENFGKVETKYEDTFHKDTKTKRTLPSIQKLNKINVFVMSSTDNINEEILNPNLEKLHQILSKEEIYLKYLEKEPLYIRSEKINKETTHAIFVNHGMRLQQPEIIYNKDYTKKTKAEIEQLMQDRMSKNLLTKSDKNEIINHVIVHELGHYVQSILIEEKYKGLTSNKKFNKMYEAELMYNDIKEICLKKFGKSAVTSIYGDKDKAEFFAETFAEFFTTKKPSYTACALGIYLKEKLR